MRVNWGALSVPAPRSNDARSPRSIDSAATVVGGGEEPELDAGRPTLGYSEVLFGLVEQPAKGKSDSDVRSAYAVVEAWGTRDENGTGSPFATGVPWPDSDKVSDSSLAFMAPEAFAASRDEAAAR